MDRYQPVFVETTTQLLAQVGPALHDVSGTMLERGWVLWHGNHDVWWCHAPVVLEFGRRPLAISFRKFNEISITTDVPAIRQHPRWLIETRSGDDNEYEWRANALPEISAVIGQELRQIHAVWHDIDGGHWGLHGLTFEFSLGVLELFNAFDGEAGLSNERLEGPGYRREVL